MMVVESLRHGIREIKFHAFACVPGPEIFGVETSAPDRPEHWPLYPGDLVRLDMRPDLGALNFLIAPFMPTMDAWFNPLTTGTMSAASSTAISADRTC